MVYGGSLQRCSRKHWDIVPLAMGLSASVASTVLYMDSLMWEETRRRVLERTRYGFIASIKNECDM